MINDLNKIIERCSETSQIELTTEVENIISSVDGFTSSFLKRFHPNGFFRARVHNDLLGQRNDKGLWEFNSEQEFWNREAEFVTERGRCNDIKESFLYCSTDLQTAVIETKPEAGKYITVSHFEPIDPQNYKGARATFIGAQYLSKISTLEKHIILDNSQRNEEFLKIDGILDDLFHTKITDENKHLYKMSIAVTKCMMKNLFDGRVQYPVHAMLYPSVERNNNQFNIIYRPIHARTHFEIKQMRTFYIAKENDSEIELILKRFGTTIQNPKFDLFDFYEILWQNVPFNQSYRVNKLEY